MTFIAVGREQLGFDFTQVSHSAYYNRIGFALLALIAIECFVEPRSTGRAARVAGGSATGFAVAILLFVKPTAFLAAIVFLAMSAALLPRSRTRLVAIGCGSLAGLLLGGALIGFRLDAMLSDYGFVAAARRPFVFERLGFFRDMTSRDAPVLTPGRITETVLNDFWPTALAVTLAWIVPVARFRNPARAQVLSIVVLTWGLSMALLFTSWQWGHSPLFAVVALALLECGLRTPQEAWRRLASIGVTAACVASFLGTEAGSILYDIVWQAHYDGAADTFPGSAAARGLVIDNPDGYCRHDQYAKRIVEGMDAIRAVPDPRVAVLDFSNPFPFLMQSRPARGGGLCWHFNATVSEDVFLTPERMLGDANVVVVAKCAEDADAAALLARLYAPALMSRFRLLKDTGALLVLVRTD